MKHKLDIFSGQTPKSLGYHFPAEFAKHDAIWLSWPHKEESWPGKIHTIYPYYCQFIKELTHSEVVCINVLHEAMQQFAIEQLQAIDTDLSKVQFYMHPTNDAWCRDHGPAFLVNPTAAIPKIIVDWNYIAWGG